MVHAVAAGLDQSEAVMPRVDVEEVGAKRLLHVIAEPEAEQVDIERHHRVDVLDREHGVSQAERAGAESGDRTSRTERRLVDLRAIERLEAVARRGVKRKQAANTPWSRERLRLGDILDLGLFEPGRECVQ